MPRPAKVVDQAPASAPASAPAPMLPSPRSERHFVSLLDVVNDNTADDSDSDGVGTNGSGGTEAQLSIEAELRLLRAGGPALLHERTLAAAVGTDRALRLEVAQSVARLKRFSAGPHPASVGPTGSALLKEVRSFLDRSITENELQAAAAKSLTTACALEFKMDEIAALKDEVAAVRTALERSRAEQASLEEQLQRLKMTLATMPASSCHRQGFTSHVQPSDHDAKAAVIATAMPPSGAEGVGGVAAAAQAGEDETEGAKALIDRIALARQPTKGSTEIRATLGRALSKLSGDIYDSADHFVHEIVQNCDDCQYAEGVVPTLRIVLRSQSVSMLWNERGFSARDVAAICDLGQSTKRDGSIGKKGVGFKSVFMVSNRPSIVSNEFSFCFDLDANGPVGALIPVWQDRATAMQNLPAEWVAEINSGLQCTVLYLPLKPSCAPPNVSIDPATVLFLRRLRRIEIVDLRDPAGKQHRILSLHPPIETLSQDAKVGPTTVREMINGEVRDTFYWVHRACHSVTIAFPVAPQVVADRKNSDTRLPSAPIFCFLPVCHVGLPFLLHADNFELTTSRQSMRTDSLANDEIIASIPKAFESAVAAIPALQDEWMAYIPDNIALSSDVWRNVCVKIRSTMANGSMFRSESGALRPVTSLLLRPPWPLPITNRQLAGALNIEFAAALAPQLELASYGIRPFTIDTMLDIVKTGELDPQLVEAPTGLYAAFHLLGNDAQYSTRTDKHMERLWRAPIFPVVSKIMSKSGGTSHGSGSVKSYELVALADIRIFRSIPIEFDVLEHTAFRVLTSEALASDSPQETILASQFLDMVSVEPASIDTIAASIVDHHRAGAATSTTAAIFSELGFVHTFYNRIQPDILDALKLSVLVPTQGGDLLSAKEVHVPSFLGLACECSGDTGSDGAGKSGSGNIAMLSFTKTHDKATDSTLSITSKMAPCPADGAHTNFHILTKVPSDSAATAVASFAPLRGKVRMDYKIGDETRQDNVHVALGFAIASTTCATFGADLYSFYVTHGGFQYNGDFTPIFEDAEQTVELSMTSDCTISTCLDLEAVAVAFCKNGEPLFFGSGDTIRQIPMQIFADSTLLPFVKLTEGTVTASFSKNVQSKWMDAQRFLPLAHWNTQAQSATMSKRHVAALPPSAWPTMCSPRCPHFTEAVASKIDPQSEKHGTPGDCRSFSASWEFFLLQLGCSPHHRACTRRSFWASLLEGGELGDCAICMAPLLGLKKALRVPACRHVFHPECIGRWLHNNVTCPVCRGTALPDRLDMPEPDDVSHMFSRVLLTTVETIAVGDATHRGYDRDATESALRLYLQDTFTRELMRNVPVTTSRGPRRLRDTFFRREYFQLGGSALPYILDTDAASVERCHDVLDRLGISCSLSVAGIIACIQELKTALAPKKDRMTLGDEIANISDDVDVIAECYGQLWARLSTADSRTQLVTRQQFERHHLLMLGDYSFVAPSHTVWDYPPTIDGIAKKRCLRPLYGSLKSLFLKGLGVAQALSFADAFDTLRGHFFSRKQQARISPASAEIDMVKDVVRVMEEDVGSSASAASSAERLLTAWRKLGVAIPLPARLRAGSTGVHLLDSAIVPFLVVDDSPRRHAAAFAGTFAEPSSVLRNAPTLYALLSRTGCTGKLAESVVESPLDLQGATVPLQWWTDAVAKFFGERATEFQAMFEPFIAGHSVLTADSVALVIARICVLAVSRITVPLQLQVYGFSTKHAMEERYHYCTPSGLVYCLQSMVDVDDRADPVATAVVDYLILAGIPLDVSARAELTTALRDYLCAMAKGDRWHDDSTAEHAAASELAQPRAKPSPSRHGNRPPEGPTGSTDVLPWDSPDHRDQRRADESTRCPHCGLAIAFDEKGGACLPQLEVADAEKRFLPKLDEVMEAVPAPAPSETRGVIGPRHPR